MNLLKRDLNFFPLHHASHQRTKKYFSEKLNRHQRSCGRYLKLLIRRKHKIALSIFTCEKSIKIICNLNSVAAHEAKKNKQIKSLSVHKQTLSYDKCLKRIFK